jgi:hypothetical protein
MSTSTKAFGSRAWIDSGLKASSFWMGSGRTLTSSSCAKTSYELKAIFETRRLAKGKKLKSIAEFAVIKFYGWTKLNPTLFLS